MQQTITRSLDKKTVIAMITLYCNKNHKSKQLCPTCRDLLNYSIGRMDSCVFGIKKPACSHCPVHCYKPQMRNSIKEVMRFSGPRMLLRHPILALRHILIKMMSSSRIQTLSISKKNRL